MPTRMLPSLAIAKAMPRNIDVLVVGLHDQGIQDLPDAMDKAFTKRFGISVNEMATSLGAKASADSKRTLPAPGDGPRIVVVGLGSDQPSREDLRRAAGAGVGHAASLADRDNITVAVSLGTADSDQLAAVAEGALLGSYQYEPISAAQNSNGKIAAITLIHANAVKDSAITSTAEIVVGAVVTAREWVNIPANLLYPESFAEQVRPWCATARLRSTYWMRLR